MNTSPNYSPKHRLFLTVLALAALLLAACTSVAQAFTPEQAVAQAVLHSPRPAVVVDVASVKALHRLSLAGKTYVVISNNQQAEGRLETCLWLFEARKSPLGGWVSSTGGGGCSSAPASIQPLEVFGGSHSGQGDSNPGVSYTYGRVNQADIVNVRVTWNDQQVGEAPVMNASYATIRVGASQAILVEGLNAQGNVVYHFASENPPGKQ